MLSGRLESTQIKSRPETATTSIEISVVAKLDVRRWFQLYVSRDREQAEVLMDHSKTNVCHTLILTVDVVVGGIWALRGPKRTDNPITIERANNR